MITLRLDPEPAIADVKISDRHLAIQLLDGRRLIVPLAWYPRLLHGSRKERQNWQLLGDGYVIEWPDLDEHIGVQGLIAGRRSGESSKSLERWLAARSRRKVHVKIPSTPEIVMVR